jgi:hypothetical protein
MVECQEKYIVARPSHELARERLESQDDTRLPNTE